MKLVAHHVCKQGEYFGSNKLFQQESGKFSRDVQDTKTLWVTTLFNQKLDEYINLF